MPTTVHWDFGTPAIDHGQCGTGWDVPQCPTYNAQSQCPSRPIVPLGTLWDGTLHLTQSIHEIVALYDSKVLMSINQSN